MALFNRFITFVTLLALVVFANPTGVSYLHSALDFNWAINPQSGFMALIGCLLLGIILFFFWTAWRSTEFMGKFIFSAILACSVFIAFTLDMFSHASATAWFVIIVLYAFFFWGMSYPRLKYALFRTRNVDDADTN